MNFEQVKAKCDDAIAAHTSSRDLIQTALVGIVTFANETGDKRPIIALSNNFIQALAGANRLSLIEYLCKYAAMKKAGKELVNNPGEKVDLEGAISTSWWMVKDDSSTMWKGFDLPKEIAKLVNKYEAAKEKGGDKVVTSPEAEKSLKALQKVCLKLQAA